MKVHTPARLAVSARFALAPLAFLAVSALTPVALSAALMASVPRAVYATESGDSTAAPGVEPTSRRTITVLKIDEAGSKGHSHALGINEETSKTLDSMAYSMAQEAIVQSHAYHLISRDESSAQVKEIKYDSEGWVNPATAQKFGKSAGIQNFMTVFVSAANIAHVDDPMVTVQNCPLNGDPVPAKPNGDPVKPGDKRPEPPVSDYVYDQGTSSTNKAASLGVAVGSLFNKHNKTNTSQALTNNQSRGRDILRANFSITCHITKVESSDRETLTFQGWAIADGPHGNNLSVLQTALKNAFDNLSRYLEKERPPLTGTITDIVDKKAIVDLGDQDGVKPDQLFEICETKEISGFTTFTNICYAHVLLVKHNQALLEIGELKKKKFHTTPEFHQDDGKAKMVHKGLIVREVVGTGSV